MNMYIVTELMNELNDDFVGIWEIDYGLSSQCKTLVCVCVFCLEGLKEFFFLLEFNIAYMYKFNLKWECVHKLGISSCVWAPEGSGKRS